MRQWVKKVIKNNSRLMSEHDMSMSALDVAIDTVSGNQIEGDYLEFGVYKGESLARAYHRFNKVENSTARKFWAFDSFEGLPKSSEAFKPKHYKTGAYSASEKTFLSHISKLGVDKQSVITVPGFYSKSLTDSLKLDKNLSAAALVYIDVDLYESVVPVFEFITDIIRTGTVIVIDDWFRHLGVPQAGIQKACYEWLEKNPHIELIELHKWRRVAFIVNINEK